MDVLATHGPGDCLPRHRHAEGYIALVLGGSYEEAGDEGRFVAHPATAVVHDPWTSHMDRFGCRGAHILNLPTISGLLAGTGIIDDPDAAVRLAERDPRAAAEFVRETIRFVAPTRNDWPDMLATKLRNDPDIKLSAWARRMGLCPASVSRGFSKAYGVTPKRYRLEARTRRALLALDSWMGKISDLAADQGFADQAHLTRSIAALTGCPPVLLRAKSVQAGHRAAR